MRRLIAVTVVALTLTVVEMASADDAGPTFNKDVAPILFGQCAECHRPNNIGPFSLLTYQDARKRAKQLARVTDKRIMPPWKPHPEWGEFKDARNLTDQQIAVFQNWVDAGTPEGNARDLPPVPKFKDGWQLGEPDLVLTMPEPFIVPADGPDIYRCFVFPNAVGKNRMVSAIEFRPGNRRVVHHSLFFADSSKRGRWKDEADPGPGYQVKEGLGGIIPVADFGAWTPGMTPRFLPDNVGIPLGKGSDVILQVHYHPTGKPETDQSTVAIYFNKNPAARAVFPVPLAYFKLEIPAGATRHRAVAKFTLPANVKVLSIQPHMHYLGREIKVEAVLPDGKRQPMIWINDWNFNWQDRYVYQETVALPKGTRLECEAFYDNSADNPLNPHRPPRTVRWGEATTEEMLLCAVYVVPEKNSDYLPLFLNMVAIPGLVSQWYFETPDWGSAKTQTEK